MYQLLLVDDEELIRQGVSENVKWADYGYELAGSCENGAEALAFLRENPVDVVLTDICMPYMDGMELSRRLYENYPKIKIIILSGYDEFQYAQKAISYGVREYLLKPITADEMGGILTELKEELDKERDSRDRITRLQATSHQGQLLRYSEMVYNLITGYQTGSENRRELAEAGISLNAAVYQAAVMEPDFGSEDGRGIGRTAGRSVGYSASRSADNSAGHSASRSADNSAGHSASRSADNSAEDYGLMAFVLYNISQEIIRGYGIGEVCQGKDHQTLFLFYSDRPQEFKRKVKEICREIMERVSQATGLSVTVGLGGRQNKPEQISRSYTEAAEALSYQYLVGSDRILAWEEIRGWQQTADIEGALSRILLMVNAGHSGEPAAALKGLEAGLREGMYDRRSAGSMLQRVVDAVEELRRRSEMEDIAVEWHKEAVLRRVLAAGRLNEAIGILTEYCEEISRQLENHKNIGGRKYAVLAMDYITQNYGDCDLTLNAVCSYLNISPSWFSSIFKTVTGTTFLEALNGIRMQKARELLAHTDMKNYQIAERVGFNDPHYFSIAFKKTVGTSPTEYAREVRK